METDTINTLEGSSYYQNNQMVEDYLDSFQSLVSDASYSNPRMLIVKFQRGLQTGIQNQIITILVGCSSDMDLEAWYEATRRIDQACLANKAF